QGSTLRSHHRGHHPRRRRRARLPPGLQARSLLLPPRVGPSHTGLRRSALPAFGELLGQLVGTDLVAEVALQRRVEHGLLPRRVSVRVQERSTYEPVRTGKDLVPPVLAAGLGGDEVA